jgi:hypothetical protein
MQDHKMGSTYPERRQDHNMGSTYPERRQDHNIGSTYPERRQDHNMVSTYPERRQENKMGSSYPEKRQDSSPKKIKQIDTEEMFFREDINQMQQDLPDYEEVENSFNFKKQNPRKKKVKKGKKADEPHFDAYFNMTPFEK